jgi:hypothetical protein
MYQNDETLPNFIKTKHPLKKGREKETRGKDQSRGKQQAAQACMYQKHCYLMDPHMMSTI